MSCTPECLAAVELAGEQFRAWIKLWPDHCDTCYGAGGRSFPGTYEELGGFDICGCVDSGKCPRCGHQHNDAEALGENPCSACGWKPSEQKCCDDSVPAEHADYALTPDHASCGGGCDFDPNNPAVAPQEKLTERTDEAAKIDPQPEDIFRKLGEDWKVRTRTPRMVWIWNESQKKLHKYMHLPAFHKWVKKAEVVSVAPRDKPKC